MKDEEIKKVVREGYARIAEGQEGCGCGTCGPDTREFAKSIGYCEEELTAIPQEANLALSCGNPTALASIKKGEVVLDLGCGAGFDCFLAATKVGPNGKVIGVDMTKKMIECRFSVLFPHPVSVLFHHFFLIRLYNSSCNLSTIIF